IVQKESSFTAEQRLNIEKTKKLSLQLNSSLQKQMQTIQSLRLEGLSTQELVVGAESNMADSEIRLANLEVQQKELEMSELQRERAQIDNQNRLSDLSLDLMKLDISIQRLQQDVEHNAQTRRNEMAELENAIVRIELKLSLESRIVSDCDGTILDVSIQPGQVVGLGTRVGTIEKYDPNGKLTNLAFFSVLDGKRVSTGDVARVTPSTVQREREGSILGVVRRISAFPVTKESVVNEVGSAEIANSLFIQGGVIGVEVELERDPNSFSGFRWTSQGPDKHFTAGTTTVVRITIEQRAPITYLLPILRSWFTGAKGAKNPRI
ncbi:MAG TPA: NHLP bacteriocin system secretion protein, partial [Pirellula sp.]|nr:NHLP bacteriocin system secretion protein [Pirellula sp.]